MKTILEINGVMNRGGAESILMDLVRKLNNDFRFVFLITCKKGTRPAGDYDAELRSMGVPIYYIDAVWDVGIKEYSRQFKNIIRKIGKIDVVHSHLNSKGGINAKCAAEAGIKKIIVHSHAKIKFNGNILSRAFNYSELYIQRHWINKYATDFWGCSEEALTSLFTPENRNSSKAQIIHNAINLERFSRFSGDTIRRELDIPNSSFVIGTIGRIASVKNYELAADIIELLWKRNIDCHYIVAGRKQTDSSVEYLFNKLGNDSRFHYIGVRDDSPAIYHGLDLYLGTSVREGLSLCAIEAQACGIPCVFSSGFPSLCDIGAGLASFVDTDNAEKWADYIEKNYMAIPKISVETIEKAVRSSGFDISSEAIKVRKLYDN